jgi:hypothetical protein
MVNKFLYKKNIILLNSLTKSILGFLKKIAKKKMGGAFHALPLVRNNFNFFSEVFICVQFKKK